MRRLLVVFALLLLSGSALCQTLTPEQVIRRMLDTGILEGHDHKVIGPMGDAAAVAVTKVLAGRNVSAADIDTVLVILESSFADPRMVDSVSDREPRTALFVLRSLDSYTADPQLKQRISATRKRIVDRFKKSM
jgi:hypothetical protein